MFGDGYVGTTDDALKIARYNKKREKEKQEFEAKKKATEDRANASALVGFASSKHEVIDQKFKNQTVGLQTRDEFVQKKQNIEKEHNKEQLLRQQAAQQQELQKLQKRREKSKIEAAKLSFADDELAGDGDGEDVVPDNKPKKLRFGSMGKDPTVETDFLPDRDRELEERLERRRLEEEWKQEQERARAEPLEIIYSYWDGAGHRRKVTVKKGDTIGQFLRAVRDQLAPEFREMRMASPDSMLYIKEDLIIPNSLTFYELIINKARGKSGPLFHFDVHEDVRVVNDARIEKDESHAGKVVERHWYDKNKHIFPASRWEVYDPLKDYGGYTIHGKEVNAKPK